MDLSGDVLSVASACSALGLRAGAVVFHGVQIGESPTPLRAQIEEEVAAVRNRFDSLAEARDNANGALVLRDGTSFRPATLPNWLPCRQQRHRP